MLDRCWDIIRRNVIPTSVSQQSESLRDLLTHFCTSDITFKSATVKNGTLNYIEVVRSTRPGKDLRKHITPTDISTVKSLRPKKTLILMHGFGSGLGFFFKNYDDLAESFDRVIAVDWLGMGGSSRQSKFKMSTETLLNYSQESPRLSVAEQIYARAMIEPFEPLPSTALAIDFFVDSLDELREQLVSDGTLAADESLHLAGHSLGGYLAAQYALKNPGKIDSLILISPVGIPEQPALSTRTKGSQMSWGLYTASSAWAMNITPQSVVRMAGPKGNSIVRNVLERRFGSRWSAVEFDLVSNYLYHISAAPALGEYSLNSILEVVSSNSYVNKPTSTVKSLPDSKSEAAETGGKEVASNTYKTFIYAREPLSKKLHELPKTIPVLVLFGDDDWLYNPADVINQNITDLQTGSGSSNLCAPSASTSSPVNIPTNEGIDITLQIIPNAGHHIYLDNAKDFNDSMVQWVTQKGF